MSLLPKVLGVPVVLLVVAMSSYGGVVDQVNVVDDVYGGFSGTINSGDTGSAAILYWDAAVFGTVFTIDFTNGSGVITDVLFSDAGHDSPAFPGDSLEFDGFLSGNKAIGTLCVAGPSTACVQTTGAVQDVSDQIGAFNGGDDSTEISILANDAPSASPEPASVILLGAGLAAFSLIRRRRTA